MLKIFINSFRGLEIFQAFQNFATLCLAE